MWVNVITAVGTTVAAVMTYALRSSDKLPIGALLGLSAGFLLYIAASDIIPEIHEKTSNKKLFDWQPVLLLLGVVVVGFAIYISRAFIE